LFGGDVRFGNDDFVFLDDKFTFRKAYMGTNYSFDLCGGQLGGIE
jgi:hypothetical protein